MPRRDDLKTICILGSGPIIIGQACEFDYSGTQAIRALKSKGYRVILVNSNPATIMTDPQVADATYIEPLEVDYLSEILKKERPDALLPTMGGQTALNLALQLKRKGILDELGIEMIGVHADVIEKAEDRDLFSQAMERIGIDQPKAGVARSLDEAWEILEHVGFPAILRPSFTMGGSGGNIAYNRTEFENYVKWALSQSPNAQVLIDESLIGWKEYELEVMRDKKDNVVIICGIENLDPLGTHTGDSVTVAPIQTLTDREYQAMRDDARKVIREIGVETGGCNIQFAVDPKTGRRVIIEMNPRVSRSSALASKATGYPIAKIAALLSVGFTLDEIKNDITQKTTAAFEPMLDYVVVKIPRFAFEKFPEAACGLTTQMKSVGEVMSIGRTFPEALLKAVSSLESGDHGFAPELEKTFDDLEEATAFFRSYLMKPHPRRLWFVCDALRAGVDLATIHEATAYDPWFLNYLAKIVTFETSFKEGYQAYRKGDIFAFRNALKEAKRLGLSDLTLGDFIGVAEEDLIELRHNFNILPVYKQVDTCAAEFAAATSYFYSTYEEEDEGGEFFEKDAVMILGSGPNRIGQGIEFDYCAVHAVLAAKELGYRTIMVNCNPETVSTDYDIADRLYFEPLTFEHVMAIIEKEKPIGIMLQFGGQTPLKLAKQIEDAKVPILGTPPSTIDLTEDREQFNKIIEKLQLRQPEAGFAHSLEDAVNCAKKLGYPILVRPSYVLGGAGMTVVFDETELREVFGRAHGESLSSGAPVLLDRFLGDAVEIDVDVVCDGKEAIIVGIMEHIEEAGVHSGDSSCVTPPYNLAESVLREIREQSTALGKELGIVGLMNIQFAVQDHTVYILEVNPRASRTIPFISKATGIPVTRIAAKAMLGNSLKDQGVTEEIIPRHHSVKVPVFPFNKFAEVDTLLGPEMRSTGEVMGIDPNFSRAFVKGQISAFNPPPSPAHSGRIFISVKNVDKWKTVPIARRFIDLGFELTATRGTAKYLKDNGIEVLPVNKVAEGQPHIVDEIINGSIVMVINTTVGRQSIKDSLPIRRETLNRGIPYFTTLSGAAALAESMIQERALTDEERIFVCSLQEYHRRMRDQE